MLNVYDGNAELDGRGEATVEMPAWFEVLKSDFRYQLTPLGSHSPLYVKGRSPTAASPSPGAPRDSGCPGS